MWKKLLVCFLALILLTGTALTVTREYAPVASAEEAQTLPAPTLKSLKATSGGIQITWSAVEGADRYQIWRSTKHNTGFGRIITVTGTSYVDKTAKMNKPYYYYIRPVNEAGAGAKSNVKGHYRAFGPKITTAVKSGSIVLSWNAPAGATSYSLYRAENGSTAYKRLTTQQATTYTDKAVTGGKTYNYYVIANYKLATGKTVTGNKGDVKSVWYGVNPVETVTATNASNGVKLTWTKRTNAKQYIIMYSTDGTNFKQIATVDGSKLTYTHTAPAWGKTVTYGVRAIFKGNGATYYAKATRASVYAIKSPKVSLEMKDATHMMAYWKHIDGVVSYQLFYREKDVGSYKKVVLKESTFGWDYTFNVQTGKTYQVYLRATYEKNGALHVSAPSAVATVKATDPVPRITLLEHAYEYIRVEVAGCENAHHYQIKISSQRDGYLETVNASNWGLGYWDLSDYTGSLKYYVDEVGTYYFSVRGVYKDGKVTAWSAQKQITVSSIPDVPDFSLDYDYDYSGYELPANRVRIMFDHIPAGSVDIDIYGRVNGEYTVYHYDDVIGNSVVVALPAGEYSVEATWWIKGWYYIQDEMTMRVSWRNDPIRFGEVPPRNPTNFQYSSSATGDVTIGWDPVSDATGYMIKLVCNLNTVPWTSKTIYVGGGLTKTKTIHIPKSYGSDVEVWVYAVKDTAKGERLMSPGGYVCRVWVYENYRFTEN